MALTFGLLIFGCNQTETKTTIASNEKPTAKTEDKLLKQEKPDDNEKLADDKIESINNVIELFKSNNVDKISDIISFPLERQYPIPSIKNKNEFNKRFSEVFDKILIDKIANSKIEQWSEVGWRGIMLDNGVLWMANSDGIITAVNYQSDFEKKLRKDLIDREKENLHNSLKTFESPTYKIKTKNYLIRIDELTNDKYRYASWKVSEKETSKPDIILNDGELEFEGSGGNHVITFVQGNYTYKVYRNIIGEESSPDIILEIEKDGKTILSEDGKLTLE
ncbi:hypothetical protein SAMN06297358_0380 [Pedobacter xixiisoli]|uniref:Uncharacterized protein n=2 Tax=Pedobacter xixiisoli TaxID=1476464 RepID=A0A285ZQE4_9SPHI|nr:hypothetical protein SAMN06297358_0380 [Pedobacter xixiisoli]